MMKRSYYFLIIAFLGVIIFFNSCNKEEDLITGQKTEFVDTTIIDDSIYYFIDGLMREWYLWNELLPDEIDVLSYAYPQDLLDALKVSIDKWSFVDKQQSVSDFFDEGKDFGFGFFLGWDGNPALSSTNLRVIFCYNNTSAYQTGIRRGNIISEINDISVKNIASFDPFFSSDAGSMKFKFIDNDSINQSVTLTKESYSMNAVLFSDTYKIDNKIIGYIVLQSFLRFSEEEIDTVFSSLASDGVTELIVDLRFNGGGYVDIAENLAGKIISKSKVGNVFFKYNHNKLRQAEFDTTVYFKESKDNLNLSRVFFITNSSSASASELVINGLSPHMGVHVIGDSTSGKPVSMYGFTFQDWVVYPVVAKSTNANGYGDYFDGLPPDKKAPDFFKYDWGDDDDPALEQAFYYIQNGTYDETITTVKAANMPSVISKGAPFKYNFLIFDN